MGKANFKKLLILTIFISSQLSNSYAISIVYNFRIAQITKQPIADPTTNLDNKKYTVLGLVFDVYQKKYTLGITQNFAGALGAFTYNFKPYFFRTDFAVSHIKAKAYDTTTFSGTEADDILFTFGRNFVINDKSRVTLSGLFGVPTHRITTLEHVGFGYGQIGLGAQFDGTYRFDHVHHLLYGTRYIYFAPRNALDATCKSYKFTIGNVADLLLALNNRWVKHGVEFGYTARFDFGSHITPNLDDIVEKTNYIRNNFYLVYKYKFKIHETNNRLLFNIAYGFDSKPKRFGNKYIITFWGSYSVNF